MQDPCVSDKSLSKQSHTPRQSQVEANPHHFRHENWQIWFMLFWSVGLAILTAVMLPVLNRSPPTGGRGGASHLER